MANSLMQIPLRQIEASPVALREVDQDDPDTQKLFDSIKREGVLSPILVTTAFMPDGKTPKTLDDGSVVYRIIEGLHRYTGSVKSGYESIPAAVTSADDARVERLQMVSNLQRIPTKAHAYGAHLKRIVARDQTKTVNELAVELSVSPKYITDRLSLNKLHKETEDSSKLGQLVDQGKITVSNAIELAKLTPTTEQLNFAEEAMFDGTIVFAEKIASRVKELRDAKRAAREPNERSAFEVKSIYRKKPETEAELQAGCKNLVALIKANGISDPTEVAVFTLKWALHLDTQSVESAKAKFEAYQKAKAERVAEAKAERLASAAAEAKKLLPV